MVNHTTVAGSRGLDHVELASGCIGLLLCYDGTMNLVSFRIDKERGFVAAGMQVCQYIARILNLFSVNQPSRALGRNEQSGDSKKGAENLRLHDQELQMLVPVIGLRDISFEGDFLPATGGYRACNLEWNRVDPTGTKRRKLMAKIMI